MSQRRAELSHSDSYRQLVTAVTPGSWASSRVSRRKCCVESNSSSLAGSRLLCASENGGEVSAAASGVADRIHPVRSSVLRCRGLPHRGAALCGYTPGCRSGFIKVPHCCPSSLRCMWTHIIGRTVSAAFKRGDMGGKKHTGREQEAGIHRILPVYPIQTVCFVMYVKGLGAIFIHINWVVFLLHANVDCRYVTGNCGELLLCVFPPLYFLWKATYNTVCADYSNFPLFLTFFLILLPLGFHSLKDNP